VLHQPPPPPEDPNTFQLDEHVLPAIWQAARLGRVEQVIRTARGSVNLCLIVNDAYVIRFDLGSKDPHRFESEAIAYRTLAGSDVPVPRVVRLDLSQTLAPYDYLITTRLPGATVIDTWAALPPAQQRAVAQQAGRYLALIHAHTFPRFGKLRNLDNAGGFDHWYGYVGDYFRRYAEQALALHIITPQVVTRIEAVIERLRPLLDCVTRPALLHSDYQWENILQQDGVITGIIDFEWAYAGDPSADLHIQQRWEQMCPGSVEPLLAGYTALRSFDAEHDTRQQLYALLLHLESLVDAARENNQPWFVVTEELLTAALVALEGG
jgi:aminoglycoside phosphotransferase (APT) family kinase protein